MCFRLSAFHDFLWVSDRGALCFRHKGKGVADICGSSQDLNCERRDKSTHFRNSIKIFWTLALLVVAAAFDRAECARFFKISKFLPVGGVNSDKGDVRRHASVPRIDLYTSFCNEVIETGTITSF